MSSRCMEVPARLEPTLRDPRLPGARFVAVSASSVVRKTLTGSRPADPTTPEIAAAWQRTPSTSRRCPQLHAVGGSTYPGQIAIPQGLDGHRFETMILERDHVGLSHAAGIVVL